MSLRHIFFPSTIRRTEDVDGRARQPVRVIVCDVTWWLDDDDDCVSHGEANFQSLMLLSMKN